MSKTKIFLAAAAAVALATPALAFDVKISGDFNNRFIYTEQGDVTTQNALSSEGTRWVNVAELGNIGLTNESGSDDSRFSGELKYRLSFTGTDADQKVKGVVGMEWGARKFGDFGADFGGDDNVFELMHAYTDFELPFYKQARLSVGLQPVGLNKWVWSDNAGGVKLKAKHGALQYDLSWFRNDFTFASANEARDAYALDVVYAQKGLPKFNIFGIYSWEDEAATSAGTASKDTQYWLGAAVDGQAGPVFYGGTFIYEGGEIEDLGGIDYDREGFLFNAEATVKAGKARIKGGYLYVSGDDDITDEDVENFGNIDAYTGHIGSVVIFDSNGDDNTPSSSPYIRDKGYNLVYAGVDYDLNDKASVGASYFWHNTAEDLTASGDDDLGHEFVVRASYKLTANLTAGIAAGYLIAGDAWEELGTATDDGDDMFVTDASIRLKF